MSTDPSQVARYTADGQSGAAVESALAALGSILQGGETTVYVAVQAKPGAPPPFLSVIFTTQRIVLHRASADPRTPPLLKPFAWSDAAEVALRTGALGPELHIRQRDGEGAVIEAIPPAQANQIHAIIANREAAATAAVPSGGAQVSQQVEYDSKSQYERIANLVVQGETLYAVFDEKGRGTGFVGITDRRLIFMDEGYIRKKKTLVSLPYSQITAIASEDSGGMVFGTSRLIVIAGSREWDFEFRSNEKAHRAYTLIMWNLLQNEKAGMMRGAH
jgi:hypothetical protein